MNAFTIQTTPLRQNDQQKAIEEIYRMFGMLSECDRQTLLTSLKLKENTPEEEEESYTLRMEISTGK